MEEVLKTYANVSLEETNQIKLEQFVYLEEFDAYYISRGDTHQMERIMESGQKKEDGTIRLQYDEYEVTLVSNRNEYYFVSNLQTDMD